MRSRNWDNNPVSRVSAYIESPQKPNPNLAMNADVTKMMFKICEADPQGT